MIQLINTQGTEITVNTEILSCPQVVGDLAETRNKTEYTCLNSNDSVMALGSITRAPITMTVLYDPDAVTASGQNELNTAFDDNTPVDITMELSDNPTGTSGTIISFTGVVSGRSKTFPKDGAIGTDYTVEISSAITVTPLVP